MVKPTSYTVKSYIVKVGNMYLEKSSVWNGNVSLTSNSFQAQKIKEDEFKEGELIQYLRNLVRKLRELEFRNIKVIEISTVTSIYESNLEIEEE